RLICAAALWFGETSYVLGRADPVGLDFFPRRMGDPAGHAGGGPFPPHAGGGKGLAVADLFRALDRAPALLAYRPGETPALAESTTCQTSSGDGQGRCPAC